MKSEVRMKCALWFIPCLLWIQNSVSSTSFTIWLHSLHFFCNYYWLLLVKNFIQSDITWQLCRLLYLYLLGLSFFLKWVCPCTHKSSSTLCKTDTNGPQTILNMQSNLPCNLVSQSCFTSRSVPHFFKLQIYLLSKKKVVFFSPTWIHIKYTLRSYEDYMVY